MSVSSVGAQASAGVLALYVLFDLFGNRYSSAGNSFDKSSGYGEALNSIASVLERKPECVCNVRTEPVIVECPSLSSVSREQVLFESWNLFVLVGIVCGCLEIWLGVCLGSRPTVKRHNSEFEPVRIDVDSLVAARRRAREISS